MLTHTEASTAASANSQIKIGEGSAYAKCILSGEHFVVYGQPALVMSLDKKISIKAVIELEDNTVQFLLEGIGLPTAVDQEEKKECYERLMIHPILMCYCLSFQCVQ